MHTTSLPVVGKPIYKLFSVASSDFSLFLGCPGPHLLPKPSQQPQQLPQPVPMKDHGSPSVSSLSSESPPVLASKSKSSSSKQSSSTSNRYHPGIPNLLNASLSSGTHRRLWRQQRQQQGIKTCQRGDRKTEESRRTMELFFSGIVKCFGDLDFVFA